MIKRFCLKVIGLVVIFVILISNISVFAASKTDLQNQQSDIDKQIQDAKENLDEVQSNKTEALKAISELTEQISSYEDEIDNLQNDIDSINIAIDESQKKLDEATQKYNEEEAKLQERLVAIYEAGETTYLDVLLSSSDLTDFISNYFLVSELAKYDTELLEKIEQQKQEIENAKKELEENKSKVEIAKKNKQTKSNELKSAKTTKDEQVSKLSQEEKEIQNDIDQFEKDKKAIKNELAEIARKEAEAAAKSGKDITTVPSKPSSSGYIFPVAGLSKANINNKNYPSYSGHTGVDVNIGVTGKTVVAVKAGTVEKSLAYISNGKYYSYGECIVVNHHDGTMTLYAHGLAGSRKVSKGDTVSQGQPLMTVGSTGNSSGTHLHFEVRVNGSPVNPLPYLP